MLEEVLRVLGGVEEFVGRWTRIQRVPPCMGISKNPPKCVAWGLLTFQSTRTSRARSRRPPKVLPRMIQMGICHSSGLEISNVICRRENNTDSRQEEQGKGDRGNAEQLFHLGMLHQGFGSVFPVESEIPGSELGSGHSCTEFFQTWVPPSTGISQGNQCC